MRLAALRRRVEHAKETEERRREGEKRRIDARREVHQERQLLTKVKEQIEREDQEMILRKKREVDEAHRRQREL